MKLPLAALIAFVSSSAFAWDYSTSPCTVPADLNAADSGANYHAPDSATNDAIKAEIQKSVAADLSVPLSNYSNAAPGGSELYVGDVTMNNGKVAINGVEVGSADSGSTTSQPCREESKPMPVETKQ